MSYRYRAPKPKRCRRCGRVRPEEDFRSGGGPRWRSPVCEMCSQDSPPDGLKECMRCRLVIPVEDFRLNKGCREHICTPCRTDDARQWNRDNQERIKVNSRAYREENRERISARERKRYTEHREEMLAYGRRWRKANPHKQVEADARHYSRARAAVFANYGEECACCGRTDRLSIDHIEPTAEDYYRRNLYIWLAKNGFPDGYQTLCTPCNSSKGKGERCRINHDEVDY